MTYQHTQAQEDDRVRVNEHIQDTILGVQLYAEIEPQTGAGLYAAIMCEQYGQTGVAKTRGVLKPTHRILLSGYQ